MYQAPTPFKIHNCLFLDFYMRKANALEKLDHEFHMQEVWEEVAVIYKQLILNPPSCDCLHEDLVILYLKGRASYIRAERRDHKTYDEDMTDPYLGNCCFNSSSSL